MKRLTRKYLYKFLALLLAVIMVIGIMPSQGTKAGSTISAYSLTTGSVVTGGDIITQDGASYVDIQYRGGDRYTLPYYPDKVHAVDNVAVPAGTWIVLSWGNDDSNGDNITIILARAYTVTWKDDDGTDLGTDNVADGSIPSHADPTKVGDAQYSYTFSGWTGGTLNGPEKTLPIVTGDVTYTANYTKSTNQYNVEFVDENGTRLDYQTGVDYGTVPAYNGTPTKAEDDDYTYTFDGWTATGGTAVLSDPLPKVTADVV